MKLVLTVLLVVALAGAALANGLGGERLEKVVGDQIVDVGTDQESTPVAGEPIEFDFNLLASDTREPVTYPTSVGINIGHNGKSVVNCDLIPELPVTFLFYTFPEGGNYTLTVTFFDKKPGQTGSRHRDFSAHDFRIDRQDAGAEHCRNIGEPNLGTCGRLLGSPQTGSWEAKRDALICCSARVSNAIHLRGPHPRGIQGCGFSDHPLDYSRQRFSILGI